MKFWLSYFLIALTSAPALLIAQESTDIHTPHLLTEAEAKALLAPAESSETMAKLAGFSFTAHLDQRRLRMELPMTADARLNFAGFPKNDPAAQYRSYLDITFDTVQDVAGQNLYDETRNRKRTKRFSFEVKDDVIKTKGRVYILPDLTLTDPVQLSATLKFLLPVNWTKYEVSSLNDLSATEKDEAITEAHTKLERTLYFGKPETAKDRTMVLMLFDADGNRVPTVMHQPSKAFDSYQWSDKVENPPTRAVIYVSNKRYLQEVPVKLSLSVTQPES